MVERIRVQLRLLEVLGDLPPCTGVGVRRDVGGIEDFYTLISGENVELNGFIDLSGFQLRARNITALGVQVLGKVLNKNVSTGDDLWGAPWAELPPSFQVYGIGDIRFGYICYAVLAGIIMRDLFSEPDIVCRTLKTACIFEIIIWVI